MSKDTYLGTLNDPLSQNLYAYVGNNPVVYVDPSGYLKVCAGSNGEQFVGTLTIFSHPNHSWLAYTPANGQTFTIGTWGNIEPKGIHFNREAIAITQYGYYDGRVSLTRNITSEQEKKFIEFMENNNKWDVFYNCSNFSMDAWNEVTGMGLSNKNPFGIPTPAALGRSIKKQEGYQINAPVDIGADSLTAINKISSSSNPSILWYDFWESSSFVSKSNPSSTSLAF